MADSSTILDQISSTQANKELTANTLFDAASPIMLWGRHASATTGLTWGYYGGRFVDSTGTAHAIANGTITLGASTTTYIEANATTGAVTSNTSAFTAGRIPLYTVVTNASQATSYLDYRSYQPSAVAAGGGSGTVTSVGATGGVETDQSGGAAITGAGNVRTSTLLAGGAVQTAAYTIVTGDRGKVLVMNSSSAVSQALPTPTSGVGSNFPVGWWGQSDNIGAGTMTLTVPSGLQLDGVTNGTLALAQNTGVEYFTDGTNWFTVRGGGGSGGGGSSTLAGLTDVLLSSPASGQVLTYNGTKWVNQSPSNGGGGGALVPLSRTVLGATTTTVNVPVYAGYSRLVVKIAGRSAGAGTTTDQVRVVFNGDSANHSSLLLQQNGNASAASFQPTSNAGQAYLGEITAGGATAGCIGVVEFTLDEYLSTTTTKVGHTVNYVQSGAGTANMMQAWTAQTYNNSGALTSIAFNVGSSGTTGFAAGTIVSVYGIADTGAGTTMGMNPQTGTTYTLVLGDAGLVVEMNNAAANTLTVPPDSSVNFPIGTVVNVRQTGAGQTTVAAGSGVTINTPETLLVRKQWGMVMLHKRASNTWAIEGNLQVAP